MTWLILLKVRAMNLDLSTFITSQFTEIVRLLVIILSLVHLLIGVILFRGIMAAGNLIHTASSGCVSIIAVVHILLLVGILLLVILF